MKKKARRILILAPLAILGLVVFAFLGGVVVMALWNWLIPSITGWSEITFWQAFGLLALCRILFGGHGAMGRTGSRVRERVHERVHERCDRMTDEERSRIREHFHERWGEGGPGSVTD